MSTEENSLSVCQWSCVCVECRCLQYLVSVSDECVYLFGCKQGGGKHSLLMHFYCLCFTILELDGLFRSQYPQFHLLICFFPLHSWLGNNTPGIRGGEWHSQIDLGVLNFLSHLLQRKIILRWFPPKASVPVNFITIYRKLCHVVDFIISHK